MSNFKKLMTFLLSIVCWYPYICAWGICFAFVVCFGFGFRILAFIMSEYEWFQDGRSSFFLKPNPQYGSYTYYSYTDKIKNNIYDDEGNIVGSYETDGATHSGLDKDTKKYVANYPIFMLYMIYLPIQKTLGIVISFLALFTNRFYVSVKAPDDYNDIKYYRGLHSLFNIVAERSEKKQEKLIIKQKEKQIKKEKLLDDKNTKKIEKEKKKKEQLKTADKNLGILIKVLGIIGVIVALYFILK